MGLNIGTWQWGKGNRSESRQSEGPAGVLGWEGNASASLRAAELLKNVAGDSRAESWWMHVSFDVNSSTFLRIE